MTVVVCEIQSNVHSIGCNRDIIPEWKDDTDVKNDGGTSDSQRGLPLRPLDGNQWRNHWITLPGNQNENQNSFQVILINYFVHRNIKTSDTTGYLVLGYKVNVLSWIRITSGSIFYNLPAICINIKCLGKHNIHEDNSNKYW